MSEDLPRKIAVSDKPKPGRPGKYLHLKDEGVRMYQDDPLELAAYRADMAERARAFRLKKKVVGAETGRDGTIIA